MEGKSFSENWRNLLVNFPTYLNRAQTSCVYIIEKKKLDVNLV